MPTLILPPRHTPDSQLLWRAAIHAGWEVERLSSWRVPSGFIAANPVLYGEPLFVDAIRKDLGIALLEPSNDWLPSLPEKHLQRLVKLSSLGEARSLSAPHFIKPTADKSFAARVYLSGEELPDESQLSDNEPVLVSTPVDWIVEFRAFVMERKIRTLSIYARAGALANTADRGWYATDREVEDATQYLQQVLRDNRVPLPPGVVVDVGLLRTGQWAVVEANAAWGSGIYGADPGEALQTIQQSCLPANSITQADRRWVRG